MLSIKELRGLNKKELKIELEKVQRALLEMRMGVSQEEVKKVSDIKRNRKYIAQIQTIQSEIRKEESLKPQPEATASTS